ncbi:hypothetical protein VitviT2T_029622 [Vitis vinifera]|uniref:Uncharacterized protein n=1 Tax=Vitis vinifera TaxID=29760 RepID=A0ABY9DXZ1_VITVI|nr:hypothetical protein VitviT2T_029622 [Vitis vinifera]
MDEQREAYLAPKRLNQVQFLISNICPDELPTPPSLQVSLLLRLVVLSALWHRGFILLGINMRWSKERMK